MDIGLPRQEEKIARMLSENARRGMVTHAYIFEGESGLGKVDTAMYFAASLLCENQQQAPCGKCDSCIQICRGNNPDLKSCSLKQLAEREKKSIGVGEIRGVISDAYTKPFKSKYKVYIIEDGDALTNEAQNAMLKILEEPPEYVVFIICVTSLGKILPTVQSRSRILKFFPASEAETVQYVKDNYPLMSDKANFAASCSGGIFKKVDELFSDQRVFKLRERVFKILKTLLTAADEQCVFECGEEFEQLRDELGSGAKKASGEEYGIVFRLMLSFAMDILKIKSGVKSEFVNVDMMNELIETAGTLTYEKALNCAEKITEAQEMLARHVGFKALSLSLAIGIWDF